MPTQTTGVIKSMTVPEAMSEHSQEISGRGKDSWIYSYRLPGDLYPDISYRYSGYPLNQSSDAAFRKLLAQGPQIVFENGNAQFSLQQNLDLVTQISPALGNAGDNQIENPDDGPIFHLDRMAVIELNGRNVLNAQGYFQSQAKVPRLYFSCVFVDAAAPTERCRVEECYLQAFPHEMYKEYLPSYEKMLASIKWAN